MMNRHTEEMEEIHLNIEDHFRNPTDGYHDINEGASNEEMINQQTEEIHDSIEDHSHNPTDEYQDLTEALTADEIMNLHTEDLQNNLRNSTAGRSFCSRPNKMVYKMIGFIAYVFWSVYLPFTFYSVLVMSNWPAVAAATVLCIPNFGGIMLLVMKKYGMSTRNVICPCFKTTMAQFEKEVLGSNGPSSLRWAAWLTNSKTYIVPIAHSISKYFGAGFKSISTGSLAEQCAIPSQNYTLIVWNNLPYKSLRSDHDVMLVPGVSAKESGSSPLSGFTIETGNQIPIGYAQIRVTDRSLTGLESLCVLQNGLHYLSAVNVRQHLLHTVKDMNDGLFLAKGDLFDRVSYWTFGECQISEVGPATKVIIGRNSLAILTAFVPSLYLFTWMYDSVFEGDFIMALECPKWPTCANEWALRTREWPKQDVVNGILSLGCHLVPKPSKPQSPHKLEWRWSFSLAEVMVSKFYPENAKTAYIALKSLSYQFLHASKILKTYHLKTLLLWTLECSPPDMWNDNDVQSCVTMMINRLIDHLKVKFLPHYWIPEVNLFNDITDKEADILISSLKTLNTRPYIFYSSRYNKLICTSIALIVSVILCIFTLLSSLLNQDVDTRIGRYNFTISQNHSHNSHEPFRNITNS